MSSVNFGTDLKMIEKFIVVFKMLIDPFIMISLILTLLSGLSWMIAMTKFDISYAYPFTALGYVMILIFSIIFFHEPASLGKLIGVFLIVIGIYFSSR
jgi:multidrug transporter EmrE-like cation transporter